MEAIAARAGVGKQTIYRWWPDKGALVLDAYLALVGAEQDLTVPDSGDLEADLRLILGTTVNSLADPVFEQRYRWLLRTGPISREYVNAVVAMTLRALT